ncbi:MAG: 50S ribosomal protein L9 [Spirochaetaceae bacterium]|jgi:large subunit ribosomal protein L9|nr:50S ribosomal protein L9 [Spirochaetaceae bacterium]
MKVILNKDLNPLGEEGDVREVAKGYARNYLFPRGIALPYTESTVRLFESRREEIEARKAAKRQDAAGLREKLEALEMVITMPAGANGKLYGAVTTQLVSEELAKLGYPTERKKIELAGNSIKAVGKFRAAVKLYESASAEITITVQAQEIKTETRSASSARRGRRRDEDGETPDAAAVTGEEAEPPVGEDAGSSAPEAAPDAPETAPREAAAQEAAG